MFEGMTTGAQGAPRRRRGDNSDQYDPSEGQPTAPNSGTVAPTAPGGATTPNTQAPPGTTPQAGSPGSPVTPSGGMNTSMVMPQAPAINPQRPAAASPYAYQTGSIPQTPMPTYAPFQMGQWQAPDQSGMTAQQMGLMQAILANPQTFGPSVVAAQKEAQKDTINAGQEAALQALRQRMAAHGGPSGALSAQENNIYDTSQGNLARAYRDIDINAALQNRQAELGALGAANDVMGAQLGRATQSYQTSLQGQQAQAAQNYQGYQSQADATRYALEAALAQEQARQAAGQQSMQNFALGQGAYQFDAQQQLAWQQFLENVRQGRGTLGLGYANLLLNNANQGNNIVLGG